MLWRLSNKRSEHIMYVVIFTAKINELDSKYSDLASKLRDRAIKEYGCTEFISATQGEQEIALSYWPDPESIKRWKAEELHLEAQQLGRSSWYKSYRVEICEISRSYGEKL